MVSGKRWIMATGFSLVTALLGGCGDPVTLSQSQWDCDYKDCDVSFRLTNTSDGAIEARYAIRAQSSVKTINSDMSSGLVVAEIKDKINLEAGESQLIKHHMQATRPPTNVSFKAWVK